MIIFGYADIIDKNFYLDILFVLSTPFSSHDIIVVNYIEYTSLNTTLPLTHSLIIYSNTLPSLPSFYQIHPVEEESNSQDTDNAALLLPLPLSTSLGFFGALDGEENQVRKD